MKEKPFDVHAENWNDQNSGKLTQIRHEKKPKQKWPKRERERKKIKNDWIEARQKNKAEKKNKKIEKERRKEKENKRKEKGKRKNKTDPRMKTKQCCLKMFRA